MSNDLVKIQEWYELTPKQAALAMGYVHCGVLAQAAKNAGLSYREAKRLLHEHSGFRAALNALLDTFLIDDKIKARAVIRTMMENAKSERLQFDAARHLWDRADGEPVKRIDKRETLDVADLIAQVQRLSSELHIPMTKIIDSTSVRVNDGPTREKEKGTGASEAPGDAGQGDPVQPDRPVQSGPAPGPDSEAA